MTKKNMAPPYEPTESEAACLADIQVRKKAKRPIPKVTVRENDGVATFAIEVEVIQQTVERLTHGFDGGSILMAEHESVG